MPPVLVKGPPVMRARSAVLWLGNRQRRGGNLGCWVYGSRFPWRGSCIQISLERVGGVRGYLHLYSSPSPPKIRLLGLIYSSSRGGEVDEKTKMKSKWENGKMKKNMKTFVSVPLWCMVCPHRFSRGVFPVNDVSDANRWPCEGRGMANAEKKGWLSGQLRRRGA